jgi:hypothetical protein
MTESPLVQIITLAPMFVMGYKGSTKLLPEGHTLGRKIRKTLQYGFYGWLMSMGLFMLFSFWESSTR